MVTRVTRAQQQAAGFATPEDFNAALTSAENAAPSTADDSNVNTTPGTVGDAATGDVIEGATEGAPFSINVPDTIPSSAVQENRSLVDAEQARQQRIAQQQQSVQQELSGLQQQNREFMQQMIEAQNPERVNELQGQLADVQGQFVQEREAIRSEPGQTVQSFEARLNPVQRQFTAQEQALSGQLQAAQTAAQNRISQLQTAVNFNSEQRKNLINTHEKLKEAAQTPDAIKEATRTNAIMGLIEQGVTDPSEIFGMINRDEQGNLIGDVSIDEIDSILDVVQGQDELLSVNEIIRINQNLPEGQQIPFGTTRNQLNQMGLIAGSSSGTGTGGGTQTVEVPIQSVAPGEQPATLRSDLAPGQQSQVGGAISNSIETSIRNNPDASLAAIRDEVEGETGSRPTISEVREIRQRVRGERATPETKIGDAVESLSEQNLTRDEIREQILNTLGGGRDASGNLREPVPQAWINIIDQRLDEQFGEQPSIGQRIRGFFGQ